MKNTEDTEFFSWVAEFFFCKGLPTLAYARVMNCGLLKIKQPTLLNFLQMHQSIKVFCLKTSNFFSSMIVICQYFTDNPMWYTCCLTFLKMQYFLLLRTSHQKTFFLTVLCWNRWKSELSWILPKMVSLYVHLKLTVFFFPESVSPVSPIILFF